MKKFLLLTFILITSQLSAQDLQFQWVKQIPGAVRMVTDSHDNLYIAGTFADTLSYQGNVLICDSADGSYDAFAAKFDSLGNMLWARQISGWDMEDIQDICVDNDDNLIISAMFTYTAIIENDTVTGNYWAHNILLVKYLSNGDLDWYKVPVTTDSSCIHIYKTVVDNDNNIVFCGGGSTHDMHFTDTVLDFNVAPRFMAKFSPDGDFIWVKGQQQIIHQMDIGPSGDIIYISDTLLIKSDPQGNTIWTKPLFISVVHNDDHALLALDEADNIYMAGSFYDTIVAGTDAFISLGYGDILVAKLDSNGNYIWGYQCGGPQNDIPDMLCVNNDKVVVAGSFPTKIYIENDSLFALDQYHYYPNTFIAGFDNNGNWLFDNLIATKRICSNALISMNDAIYASVFCRDTTLFDGEAFVPDSEYGSFVLAKLYGITEGIQQLNIDFSIYPNPCSDFIEVSGVKIGQGTYAEILNMNGQVLRKFEIENPAEKMDVRFLDPGIYMLKISDDKISVTQKILKI
ncbi:MAG: hypothetical protein A2W93_16200 [Bacteroidetes bacterium GWF2_43_63]|nr:MAG: hypothetical protein A2W94_11195 [Bacteroidetes bacterium GWE2_42_42]OFY54264.1 MAG: hypothetical protein A2W93_16200 [Bacteroidetes bacterium GWF2_43_63]HBG69341.1 hypothetical protein [Bacteroidales bacterium]HCB60394.1 hypothetical protein [Bacteroidales bacterium]HCY23619.1 hypothetical protein [Bacteroidales bacterium]